MEITLQESVQYAIKLYNDNTNESISIDYIITNQNNIHIIMNTHSGEGNLDDLITHLEFLFNHCMGIHLYYIDKDDMTRIESGRYTKFKPNYDIKHMYPKYYDKIYIKN